LAVEIIWIGGGILYLVLLITLGVITIRKGHWVMFIIGLFLPLFWIIGALLPPVRSRY
jgi:ABC-type multidrug transport system permease subunit